MTSLQTAKARKLLVQELVEDGAGFGEEFGAGEDVDEEAEGGGVELSLSENSHLFLLLIRLKFLAKKKEESIR